MIKKKSWTKAACGELVTGDTVLRHLKTCKHVLPSEIACPRECGQIVPSESLKRHMSSQCPHRVGAAFPCPRGCQSMITAAEIEKHYESVDRSYRASRSSGI